MATKRTRLVLNTFFVLLLLAGVTAYWLRRPAAEGTGNEPAPVVVARWLPSDIRSQINYDVLLPGSSTSQGSQENQAGSQGSPLSQDGQAYQAAGAATYDNVQGVLTYTVAAFDKQLAVQDGAIVTQQQLPEDFQAKPQQAKDLADQLGRYAQLQTRHGLVWLTKADIAGSPQVAIFQGRGLLLFIQSSKEFSNQQWQTIMDSLRLVSPS